MSIESVMPSSHLILCHPLLLLFSIFPRIRVFSNELALHIRWPSIVTAASVLPVNIQGWFPLGLACLTSLRSLSRVFPSTTIWKPQFFSAQSSSWSNSHIHKEREGLTDQSTDQTQHFGYFYRAYDQRVFFMFFNGWKEEEDALLIYKNHVKSQFQSRSFILILSAAAFMLQEQNWAAVTEAVWSTKPKTFTMLRFTEKKFSNPWLGARKNKIKDIDFYWLFRKCTPLCPTVK